MNIVAVPPPPHLHVRRMGLHAQHQSVAVMHTDCHVCHAEGLAPRSRVLVSAGDREVIAVLYQTEDGRIGPEEVALSESAWQALGVADGDPVQVSHAPWPDSLADVRRRIHGHRLGATAYAGIVNDVVHGRYTDVQLASFLTATATLPMLPEETVHLTRAMIAAGRTLSWHRDLVVDKHCVGGLPGNRTTPIVVAIAAANGLVMPKTSSRAITSPAGTADTMETLTAVDLDLDTLRAVVQQHGGCLAWGGAMQLSPADDLFVRIERELDIDTEGQLVASVLSKKIAAGATDVVIDIPIGPTAKVRSQAEAEQLAAHLAHVALAFGVQLRCLYTDGTQPVGRGIGPALEAADVLAVLQGLPEAPDDLRQRATEVAAAVLEIGGAAAPGTGLALARETLDSGRAWQRFQAICKAQGGLRTPPQAAHVQALMAADDGMVSRIDNRRLSRLAKLAGAPERPAAGVRMNVRLGDMVRAGQPLLEVHAQSPGELAYALDYARRGTPIIGLGGN